MHPQTVSIRQSVSKSDRRREDRVALESDSKSPKRSEALRRFEAELSTTSAIRVNGVRTLFDASQFAQTSIARRNYDIAPERRFFFVRRSGRAQPGATVVVKHLADKVPGARCEVQVGGDGTFELHLFCRKRHHVSGVDSRVDLRFARTMRHRVRWRAGMEAIAGF